MLSELCLDSTFWICFWDIWLFIDVVVFFFAFFSSYQPLELFLLSKKIVYDKEIFVNLVKECKVRKLFREKLWQISHYRVVFQLLSHILLFVTPWTLVHQAPLSSTISWSLLKLQFEQRVSDAIQPSHPLSPPSPH